MARIAIALALPTSVGGRLKDDRAGEALFLMSSIHWARFNGFNVCHDLMALWAYIVPKSAKNWEIYCPNFWLFMDYLKIHIF